eukprot:331650-Chlamydomonas_euryale.AAC.1
MTLPTFKLSGKELLVTDGFKYLGAFFADDGPISREMDVRNVCPLAAFRQFQDIWASPKLSNKQKNGRVPHICFAHFLVRLRNVDMDGGSDGQARGHSF